MVNKGLKRFRGTRREFAGVLVVATGGVFARGRSGRRPIYLAKEQDNVGGGEAAIPTGALGNAGTPGTLSAGGAIVRNAGDVVLPPGATAGGTGAGTADTDATLTAFGYQAAHTSGLQETAVGYRALLKTQGNGNTAVGAAALQANTTGAGNCAVGNAALSANTTGGYNVAMGQQALRSNATGSGSVSLGSGSMRQSVASSGNVAVGNRAMENADDAGGYNVAIGYQALRSYVGTTAGQVAIGSDSQAANTTGARNVAVGGGTLYTNTTGSVNTAIGDNVLHLLTTGQYDTAVGVDSQKLTTTGVYNTSIGVDSLCRLTTGSYNTGLGEGAGSADNIGGGSGFGTVAGSYCTFVGHDAAIADTSDPSYVTVVGALARVTGNGAVAIGCDHTGTGASAAGQDSFVLGTALHTVRVLGLFVPAQADTASAPTYVKGAVYFDTTLNKLRVGGTTAWETVISS